MVVQKNIQTSIVLIKLLLFEDRKLTTSKQYLLTITPTPPLLKTMSCIWEIIDIQIEYIFRKIRQITFQKLKLKIQNFKY